MEQLICPKDHRCPKVNNHILRHFDSCSFKHFFSRYAVLHKIKRVDKLMSIHASSRCFQLLNSGAMYTIYKLTHQVSIYQKIHLGKNSYTLSVDRC